MFKKFFLAYLILIGLPLAVLYSGIGTPVFAGCLVIMIAVSSVVLGLMVVFMSCDEYSKNESQNNHQSRKIEQIT